MDRYEWRDPIRSKNYTADRGGAIWGPEDEFEMECVASWELLRLAEENAELRAFRAEIAALFGKVGVEDHAALLSRALILVNGNRRRGELAQENERLRAVASLDDERVGKLLARIGTLEAEVDRLSQELVGARRGLAEVFDARNAAYDSPETGGRYAQGWHDACVNLGRRAAEAWGLHVQESPFLGGTLSGQAEGEMIPVRDGLLSREPIGEHHED